MSIIFSPDAFTVGADANIDAYPGTPNYAYSRGSGTNAKVIAANDNVQCVIGDTDVVVRCINGAIPANLLDQEVRANCRANGTTPNVGRPGLAVRYSTTTRGYVATMDNWTANELSIYEDDAGYTLLASADRGLVPDVTYAWVFSATGPTDNTVLSLTVGGTAALTFNDTSSVTGSPGIYVYRDFEMTQANTWVDDFLVEDLISLGANAGSFDAELNALAWFDPTALFEGWYDYGMPFSHPLIEGQEVAQSVVPVLMREYRARVG